MWNYSFIFTRFFRKCELDTTNIHGGNLLDNVKEEWISMRILIYGAGVIGSLYAALFAEAGYDTSI